MSITLREATLDDVEAICDVNLSAFGDETVSLQTLPRASGSGKAFLSQGLLADMQDPKMHILVITDDENDKDSTGSGDIIAFAKWKAPGSRITGPPPAEAWPQDGNPQLAVRFFGRFAEVHHDIMQDREHWYLELVSTRKGAGGRGAASKLLDWGLERADREGLPVFLEATAVAEGIYERRFGFRSVRRELIDVQTETIDVPFMVREPRTREQVEHI